MKRLKSIVLTALAVILVASNIPVSSAGAQSSALSIEPRKDFVIEAGDGAEGTISIRNLDTVHDLTLYLQVIDFTYTDDSGTPKLLLGEDQEPTPWSLKNYLKVPTTAKIKAGKRITLDMSIKIPSNLGAGSYYSAVVYSTSAPSGGNLGLAASGVTLAFVTVPGEVDENLVAEKLGAYDIDAGKYNFFNVNEPLRIGYTLKNEGNVFEAPVGTITLKSMWGQEHTINNINPNKKLALIGQTRTFDSCIKLAVQNVDFQGDKTDQNTCVSPGLWPGFYNVSLNIFYGQNGNLTKELNKTAVFWYLPLWFIIAASVVILAGAFYIWRTVVFIRGGSFKLGGSRRPQLRKSSHRRR
jgi:hypothetical protein